MGARVIEGQGKGGGAGRRGEGTPDNTTTHLLLFRNRPVLVRKGNVVKQAVRFLVRLLQLSRRRIVLKGPEEGWVGK